ncbi:hypothetical protein M231_01678 [Tremella mesenterica]|uniref:Uncharacterized protein n=1 Tax=Tremella mesenterica TaxID=5217 RepID=A0A4V1M4P1_TREME|nr:hypothetical protein M231_01678 [Tremella mesenterica]
MPFDRKRAVSNAENLGHGHPIDKSPSSQNLIPQAQITNRSGRDQGGRDERGGAKLRKQPERSKMEYDHLDFTWPRISDAAPTLDMDFRSSLLLQSLSQRFSVLLPSLSAAPEPTIRDIFAQQRARHEGPSITEAEEELVLAEIRDASVNPEDFEVYRNWDGVSPTLGLSTTTTFGGRPFNGHKGNITSFNSTSSHVTYTTSPTSPASAPVMPSNNLNTISPPPTSTSFSSFQTFGVGGEEYRPKVKSHGFGSQSLKDDDYIRRTNKTASRKQRNVSGSVSSKRSVRSEEDKETPTRKPVPLPNISPDKANAYWNNGRQQGIRAASPSESEHTDRTATPTPFSAIQVTSSRRGPKDPESSHSSTSGHSNSPFPTAELPPTPGEASHVVPKPKRGQRQSLLHGFSPAQMKRISMALLEAGDSLQRHGSVPPKHLPTHIGEEGVDQDLEELLAPPVSKLPQVNGHSRQESTSSARSAGSGRSQLPPSPRSHNLAAHVTSSIAAPVIPQPVLTPVRTLPVRHTPSLSSVSTQSSSPAVPVYIPGQPRPVRSLHQSEGSTSTRAPTPQQSSNSQNSPQSTNTSSGGRARSDSTPAAPGKPHVVPPTTSLGRSRSTNHAPSTSMQAASARGDIDYSHGSRFVSVGESVVSRGPSPLAIMPHTSEVIEECDEQADERGTDNVSVDDREHEVFASREAAPETQVTRDRRSIEDVLQESVPSSQPLPPNMRYPRAGSEEGIIGYTSPSTSRTRSPSTLRKVESSSSISSSYIEPWSDDVFWEDTFGFTASYRDEELPRTPDEGVMGDEVLRLISGVGKEELVMMQEKLVAIANQERQALRDADDSMAIGLFTPILQGHATFSKGMLPSPRSASPTHRPVSPPSAWRSASPPPSGSSSLPTVPTVSTSPIISGDIFTPPPSADRSDALTHPRPAQPLVVSRNTSFRQQEPTMPPTPLLSRSASSGKSNQDRPPLHTNPEVVRDFEARLAKATAELHQATTELHRTPSGKAGRLERKTTKRGDKFAISNPKLVSSSYQAPASPITPPDRPNPQVAGALEKASGSASKMSLRWKKLGFKRGPSTSNDEEAKGRSTSNEKPKPKPVHLAGPIDLRSREHTGASPDLNAFRFPPASADPTRQQTFVSVPSPPQSAQPGLKGMMDKLRHGRTASHGEIPKSELSQDRPVKTVDVESSGRETPRAQPHQPTPSDESNESAMIKFIEAGKALGLNDQQLSEMLAKKGMLNRSGTSTSSRSIQSTAPTSTTRSQTSPTPQVASLGRKDSTAVQRKPSTSDKSKGSLFRSLSKNKKNVGNTTESAPEVPTRKQIVRRTLLIPQMPVTLASPSTSTNQTNGSNEASASVRAQTGPRKLSIKRKPVNLTEQDRELVQNSPKSSSHFRKPSGASGITNASIRSVSGPTSENDATALGFLHPSLKPPNDTGRIVSSALHTTNGEHRGSLDDRSVSVTRSSAGGSIYDLYSEETGYQEMLASPPTPYHGERPITQAVEICEYEDGEIVWSLIDGLRARRDSSDMDLSFHQSRNPSFGSSKHDSVGIGEGGDGKMTGSQRLWKPPSLGNVQGLNLRHKERTAPEVRPETHIYHATAMDVAELIDQLSRDTNVSDKGRIDIRDDMPSPLDPTSPAFQYAFSTNGDETALPSPNPYHQPVPPQARHIPPGPGPGPIRTPASATVPASGFSPKRQMFVKHAFPGHQHHGSSYSIPSHSPTAASFVSSVDGPRTVEERLQALLDRLKDGSSEQEHNN